MNDKGKSRIIPAFALNVALKAGIFFFIFLLSGGLNVSHGEENNSTALKLLQKSVPRFALVDKGIYRSGQLHEDVAPLLKALGIKTVVNLLDDPEDIQREGDFLEDQGIQMYSEPWDGFGPPDEARIDRILSIMTDPAKQPVLVHCKRGAERTGLTIGIYRIRYNGWTADQAFIEMKEFDFRSFWFGHMKTFLYQYEKKNSQTAEKGPGIFERTKTKIFSGVYALRKVLPFLLKV